MTGRPARYSCEFKYVLFFSVMVQGQFPNNFECPYWNDQADCNTVIIVIILSVVSGC